MIKSVCVFFFYYEIYDSAKFSECNVESSCVVESKHMTCDSKKETEAYVHMYTIIITHHQPQKNKRKKKRLFFLCPNQIITTAEVKKQKTLSLQTPNMKKYPNTRNHIYIIFIAYQFFIHFMLPSPHHHHLCPLVDSWGWLVVTHLKQRTKRSLQKLSTLPPFFSFFFLFFFFDYLILNYDTEKKNTRELVLIFPNHPAYSFLIDDSNCSIFFPSTNLTSSEPHTQFNSEF